MREILFRGKEYANGTWVYGLYTSHVTSDGRRHSIEYSPNTMSNVSKMVDPETVCQYTGMMDARREKIFEGDIIESHDDAGELARHKVEFDEKLGCYIAILLNGPQRGYFFPFGQSWVDKCKKVIVGNIYDNPELQKGGKK